MKVHTVDIKGFKADLPILTLPSGIGIAFFNLHGDSALTEHCAKELAPLLSDCEVLITAESKVQINCKDDALQATVSITVEAGCRVTGACGGDALNCPGAINADTTAMEIVSAS